MPSLRAWLARHRERAHFEIQHYVEMLWIIDPAEAERRRQLAVRGGWPYWRDAMCRREIWTSLFRDWAFRALMVALVLIVVVHFAAPGF